MSGGVLIAGAGQAGFQTAASLRSEGYSGPITLIGDEPHIPYQRPPLSKDFMAGKMDPESLPLRPESFYAAHRIDLRMGERVESIDSIDRRVTLSSGSRLPWDSLVLATGARNRLLPVPGGQLDSVCYLRTVDEAVAIQERLETARNVVIVGGGFIGLEMAAVAAAPGRSVLVVEAQPRLMPRVVAPVISAFFLETHTAKDVRFELGKTVIAIRPGEVELSDGSIEPADLVIVGIGVVPNSELAAGAGLAVDNGITVNEYLETAASGIYAIGDCAWHPNRFAGGYARLESVQNGVDQARRVAAAIAGKRTPYDVVPWFWTDQFDLKLQMAGLSTGFDQAVTRGQLESRRFSVFYFRESKLVAVDSVNRPADHVAARKLLASRGPLAPEQAADLSFDLKGASAGPVIS